MSFTKLASRHPLPQNPFAHLIFCLLLATRFSMKAYGCDRFCKLQLITTEKGRGMVLKRALMLTAVILFSACTRPPESNHNGGTRNESLPAASEARDADGNTPLINAVNKGDAENAKKLIDAGSDVNAASSTGVTPLMNAAGMGNKDIVQMLIDKGADVNAKTTSGYNALMSASLNGQEEIVRLLVARGADPKMKDLGGRTAADYAAEHNHKEIVQFLSQK
jgi:uncharacterized protein